MKHRVALGIFLFCLILSIILAPMISVSWDEPDNIFAAGVYIKYFQQGMDPSILTSRDSSASYFQNKIFTQEPSLNRYPPVPLYIGGVLVLMAEKIYGTLSATQIITIFHIASGLFWSMLAVGVFYFADLFGFPLFIAFLSAFLVTFHPTIFGYGLSTIKDSAQVSLFVLSLLCLVKFSHQGKKRYFFFGTLVWGAAMATKINAIYVPIIWTGWCLLEQFFQSLRTHTFPVGKFLKIIRNTILLVTGGGVVMFILWPYLWAAPVQRFGEVLSYFTTVGTGYKVFWNGDIYMAGTGIPLPWYPILHILLGTPIPLLLMICIGIITIVLSLLMRLKKVVSTKWILLVFLWIAIPLIRTLSPHAAFYDGMRHFLEVIPGFLLLIPWGIHPLTKMLTVRLGNEQKTRFLIGLPFLIYIPILLIHFFPYSYGYVNAFVRHPNTVVERDFACWAIYS